MYRHNAAIWSILGMAPHTQINIKSIIEQTIASNRYGLACIMKRLIEFIGDNQIQEDHVVQPLIICYQVIKSVKWLSFESVLIFSEVSASRLWFDQSKASPSCMLLRFEVWLLQVFELGEYLPKNMMEKDLTLIPQFNLDLVVMQTESWVDITILLIQNTAHLRYFLKQVDIKQVYREKRRRAALIILPIGTGMAWSWPHLTIGIVADHDGAVIE